ncbi:hypothetical protein B0H14DRAFT_3485210 [Mycena olivaceomarginata]|nr:hypothetical protein B0H14DRAFT_3485210 [Mycena olivaceomarginata]
MTVTLGGDPQSPQTHLPPLPLLPVTLWIRAGGGRLDVDVGADTDLQISSNSLEADLVYPGARQPSRNYNSCPHLEPTRFTSLLCAPYTSTLYISICESTVVQRVIRGLKRFHGEKDRSQSPGPSYSPSSHSSDPASFPATQPFTPPTGSSTRAYFAPVLQPIPGCRNTLPGLVQLATKDYSDVEHS